jgi:hypothetical protein
MGMSELLSRDEFRDAVFTRDKNRCVICGAPAVDAHHILDRRLFHDGGYYLDNGASLCSDHHLAAEMTTISCDDIRMACGIKTIILPDHLHSENDYDKWGNTILPSGLRVKGELFHDEPVQKMLSAGRVLDLFVKYYKYPRTYHLPWSNASKDDRMLPDDSQFYEKRVIASLKMDGENCLGPDSTIITEHGKMTIRELCETEYVGKVLSYDIENSVLEFNRVIAHNISIESNTDQWFEIELENGDKLEITSDHYVYLPYLKCYRRVKDLNVGDDIEFVLL